MEMDATFATGRLTFSERLGWDVTVKDGYERDEFDDAKVTRQSAKQYFPLPDVLQREALDRN